MQTINHQKNALNSCIYATAADSYILS